jgi:predicted PurR-regulated permease PerM
MISERNIGYWMLLAILFFATFLIFSSVWVRFWSGVLFLVSNTPIFIYFSRKSRNLPRWTKIRYRLLVLLSVVMVAGVQVLFALPIWGIVELIRRIV